jgi:hypothetical protein
MQAAAAATARLLSEPGANAGAAEGSERVAARLLEESSSAGGVAGEVGVAGMKGFSARASAARAHACRHIRLQVQRAGVQMLQVFRCCRGLTGARRGFCRCAVGPPQLVDHGHGVKGATGRGERHQS